jgi:hypothetical protein
MESLSQTNNTMKKIIALVIIVIATIVTTNAQLRKVPATVTDAFKIQFAAASQVEWKDRITNFEASFKLNNINHTAKFTKEGTMIETTGELDFVQLPSAVKDGFNKSKFSDWQVKAVITFQETDKPLYYRITVKKNDITKRFLYFDKTGKLVKDTVTL